MSELALAHKELFWLIANREIGSGMSRKVWDSKVLSDSVIKVEEDSGCFQNVLEWEAWNAVKETAAAKWFAPCEWISPCGVVLIMAKTTPTHKYPDRMPAFLADFKRPNYGMYKGRLVCHDYGTSLLMINGLTTRMRKVQWWQ